MPAASRGSNCHDALHVITRRQLVPRALRLPLAVVAACAIATGCGDDDDEPAPKRVTIDVTRKVGTRVRVVSTGIINHPAAVAIRVSAAPRQRVEVTWGLSCPRTAAKKDKDAGTGGGYVTTPPNVRALRLPRRKIAFCAVRGEARLTRKGRVKVTLLGTKR
jgi:hypothetical protein